MCRRLSAAAAAFVALFLVPIVALGQPLSDRVPADAIIYVGWNGTSNLGASYDQSRFKALLEESNIPELCNDLMPRIIQRVAIEDQQAAAVLQKISDVATPVWRHPTAFYFAGLEFPKDGQGEPKPRAALLCKPGEDAEAMQVFADTFETLERLQKSLAERFELDQPGVNFEKKKEITSAMRRLAPIGLSTTMGWTATL